MQGVKRITRTLGFGEAPMPTADPKAKEGICPLCGNYGPLSVRMGWCFDRECKNAARDMLRHEAYLGVCRRLLPDESPETQAIVTLVIINGMGEEQAAIKLGTTLDDVTRCVKSFVAKTRAFSDTCVVPGEYYRVGDTELVNLAVFESYAEPELPARDPALCQCGDCPEYALVNDTLCTRHRLEANHKRYQAQRNQRQGGKRKRKGRYHKQSVGNRIRGLDKLKLK